MSFRANRRAQRGLTLLELLLSITVGLTLIGVGIGVYSSTQSSALGLQAANEVQHVAAGIREVYTRSPNYVGLTTASMIQAGKAPKDMISGATVVNAFRLPVIMTPDSTGGVANALFSFTYGGVPREQCVALVMSTQASFDYVQIGTGDATGAFTAGNYVKRADTGVVPTTATVTTECNRPVSAIRFVGR